MLNGQLRVYCARYPTSRALHRATRRTVVAPDAHFGSSLGPSTVREIYKIFCGDTRQRHTSSSKPSKSSSFSPHPPEDILCLAVLPTLVTFSKWTTFAADGRGRCGDGSMRSLQTKNKSCVRYTQGRGGHTQFLNSFRLAGLPDDIQKVCGRKEEYPNWGKTRRDVACRHGQVARWLSALSVV